ncbi:MAG: AI-2E family transporter [Lachnospiraceae bacterium]|nr:AI-2E family transporter [Lachnospiraceae bacterium]
MRTRYIILGLTALALFLVFRFLLPLVLPFVLAYFFAKTVAPIIHFLTAKLKWKKRVSVIMVVCITVFAVSGFLFYITSMVIGQAILLLQKIPVYQQFISEAVEQICCQCDQMLELRVGTSYQYIEAQTENLYHNLEQEVIPWLYSCAAEIFRFIAQIGAGLFIFFVSTLLILLDDSFPRIHKKMRPIAKKLKYAGFAYIKAQGIILFIVAVVISLGLFLMGNDYAVLFGIGIAIFDAFPIVGSGVVLVPWAILEMIGGHFYQAAILLTVFVVSAFLREILEPRLFGKEIGMKPLFVLISVYVGVALFQIGGIILGPVALTILKVVNEVLLQQEKAAQEKEKSDVQGSSSE